MSEEDPTQAGGSSRSSRDSQADADDKEDRPHSTKEDKTDAHNAHSKKTTVAPRSTIPSKKSLHQQQKTSKTNKKTRRMKSDPSKKSEDGSGVGLDPEQKVDSSQYMSLLQRHYERKNARDQVEYKVIELFTLLDDIRAELGKSKTLDDVPSNTYIVGDIHGQFNDLLAIFQRLGVPPDKRYVFLGDYIDRGLFGLECIVLLFVYKLLFPSHICLLRGNHECARINKTYGFYDELRTRFGKTGRKLWLLFNRAFDELPVYALVGGKVLCMHGGLSPQMPSIQYIRNLAKPIKNPISGVINDSLWADPDFNIKGWQPSTRGTSFCFGEDVVKSQCAKFGLELIVRAHQVCLDGYWFFADKRLITIFSAPNYCGVTDNAGAVLHVSEDLLCTLHLFVPAKDASADIVKRILNNRDNDQQQVINCSDVAAIAANARKLNDKQK